MLPRASPTALRGDTSLSRDKESPHNARHRDQVCKALQNEHRLSVRWIRPGKSKAIGLNTIWRRVESCLLLGPGVEHQLEEKGLLCLLEPFRVQLGNSLAFLHLQVSNNLLCPGEEDGEGEGGRRTQRRGGGEGGMEGDMDKGKER